MTYQRKRLFFLLSVTLIVICYSNTFNNQFVFDDYPNIVLNPKIRLSFENISLKTLYDAAFSSILSKRPVANLSFALNHLFHGYNVTGYHVVNLIIHIINSFLVFIVLRHVYRDINSFGLDDCSDPEPGKNGVLFWVPATAALMWSVHPINTQSVTYVVQRMNSLSAMFYLLAFLIYLRSQKKESWNYRSFCLFISFWLLGVFSKENAIMLPLTIIMHMAATDEFKKTSVKKNLHIIAAGVFIFFWVIFYFTGSEITDYILRGYKDREFNLIERLMTQPRVILHYLGLLILPLPSFLNLDHHVIKSVSLVNPPSTILSLACCFAVIFAALINIRKFPLLAYSVLWFFINIALESSVVGLELMFEHRVYLPSIFLFLLFFHCIASIIKNKNILFLFFMLLVLSYSIGAYQRNLIWKNGLTLWEDCVKKSPLKARTNNNLANQLVDSGKYDEAYKYFYKATELKPDYYEAYYNWGNALFDNGKFSETAEKYQKAIELKPDYAYAYNNLGLLLEKEGNYSHALKMYQKAITHKKNLSEGYINIARIKESQKLYAEASTIFENAIMLNPYSAELYYAYGNLLMSTDDLKRSGEFLSKALKLRPDYPEVYNSLGVLFMKIGKIAEAKNMFLKAISILPSYSDAKNNLLSLEQK